MATKKRAAKVAPESTAKPLASERRMFELTHWSADDVARFLKIRQEFFLDPMGSNKDRFVEAAVLLQRALFDWYLQAPGKFEGMTALVGKQIEHWSALRKEERRTLNERRFALNSAAPDIPAVESSVSANQWQRIFGSLGLGLGDPGTFDRFLVQLDEETNPSLRVNHRYLGELLPHDNMISYLSSMLATFLNENAIIGKASPSVTHMEEAAVRWLLTLVGWDGGFRVEDSATLVPLQRLPTIPAPNQDYERWTREEPTGNIVAGGTIANISAMMIARSAVFDYLLCWDGAVQSLGPALAWECVREIWGYRRMVVLTSLQTHYSIDKAALQAGLAPCNVLKVAGSRDPWLLDAQAVEQMFAGAPKNKDPLKLMKDDLVIAVVLIAGKTETGYVDELGNIAQLLNKHAATPNERTPDALPSFNKVAKKVYLDEAVRRRFDIIVARQAPELSFRDEFEKRRKSYIDEDGNLKSHLEDLTKRCESGTNEICDARHNRLFLHVDAAHGAGYLTVPALRHGVFRGIEHADTITIDGHKSLYCYYPCGGLLIRTKRWARTLAIGSSEYISEEANHEAYDESVAYFRRLAADQNVISDKLIPAELTIDFRSRNGLTALQKLIGRSVAEHSELTHQPFNQYLEGSRGPQGIMQLYFGLATLGMRGYRSILEWTYLLRERCEEAISLGLVDLRLVDDRPFNVSELTKRSARNEGPGDEATEQQVESTHGAGRIDISGLADVSLKSAAIAYSNPTPTESVPRPLPQPALAHERVMPIGGGRFLRLSGGVCNQLLLTYVPARESKLIAAAPAEYWQETNRHGRKRVVEAVRFLWRVNEYLWNEHLYANPTFTYYLGHTPLKLALPTETAGATASPKDLLATLLRSWNVWAQTSEARPVGFFDVLAEEVAEQHKRSEAKRRNIAQKVTNANSVENAERAIPDSEMKFFCHKVIIMHPYTDESLLGDMLRRVAFWGEQSMTDVHVADGAAEILSKP